MIKYWWKKIYEIYKWYERKVFNTLYFFFDKDIIDNNHRIIETLRNGKREEKEKEVEKRTMLLKERAEALDKKNIEIIDGL